MRIEDDPNCLSADELRRFLAAASELTPRVYPLFCTLVFTGGRFGEVTPLKWSDIDEERGAIRIRRALLEERPCKGASGLADERRWDRVERLRRDVCRNAFELSLPERRSNRVERCRGAISSCRVSWLRVVLVEVQRGATSSHVMVYRLPATFSLITWSAMHG